MKFDKPALNVKQQIKLLKSRGLIIENDDYAEKILSNITYYRLSAYMKFFQKADNDFSNIKLEDIINLYNFDKDLRSLIFDNIRLVEIALRTKICLHMCSNYGAHWFYDKNNFKNDKSYNCTSEILKTEKGLKKDTFIKYYFEKYSEPDMPPFWMISEVLSMGDLSKILNCLNLKDLKAIASEMAPDDYTAPVISNWIHVLATVRNICAHHSRLWNRELRIKFAEPLKISTWKTNQVKYDKVYAVCFVLFIFLKYHPCSNFENQLKELFLKYPTVDITKAGFPVDWNGFV